MKFTRHLFIVALAFATSSLAHAGFYIRGSALYTKPSDLSVNSAAAFKASLKNNVGVAGALGYKFSLLRVEGELQRLSIGTEANELSGTTVGGLSYTSGKVKETSGFANAYVDFPSFLGLAPYLGAGLGYARVNLDNVARINNGRPLLQLSGRDTVFGYQGMAGLQYHFLGQATIHAGFRLVKKEDVGVRDVVANAVRTLSSGTNRVFEIGLAVGF